jgi:hypothetical protein
MDHATNDAAAEPMLQKQEALLGEMKNEPHIMEKKLTAKRLHRAEEKP